MIRETMPKVLCLLKTCSDGNRLLTVGIRDRRHEGQGDGTANDKLDGKRPSHFIHLFMFHFSPTSSAHSPRHRPPPRVDGLQHNGELEGLDDELRDFKRVHDQGQEEDLRMALSRTITKVEGLVRHCISNQLSFMARSLLTRKNMNLL